MVLRLDLSSNLLTGKPVGIWPYGFLNKKHDEVVIMSREDQLITSSYFYNMLMKMYKRGCCNNIRLRYCSTRTYVEWTRALKRFRLVY